jgi:hypothetical protein
MIMGKVFRLIVVLAVVQGVLIAGCEQKQQASSTVKSQQEKATPAKGAKAQIQQGEAPKPKPVAVEVSLKPAVGQAHNYKVASHMKRIIKWEGAIPAKDIPQESFSDDMLEMVLSRRVESRDANGDSIAQVTIDHLKYSSIVKNVNIMDFNSSMPSDSNSPLAGLIGQSYTLTVEPNNYISAITSLPRVNVLMKGLSSADQVGKNILSEDTIRSINSTLILPSKGREKLLPGDKWSRIKTFGFGLMGIKSYEKIYTLKDVQDVNGHKIAFIAMNAIPSSEVESKFVDQQGKAGSSTIFDTNEVFTGKGEIDLTAGYIKSYSEDLKTNWIAAVPGAVSGSSDVNNLTVLKMTAIYSYAMDEKK